MLLLCEEKFEGRIALFDIDLAKKGSLYEIPLANSSGAFFFFLSASELSGPIECWTKQSKRSFFDWMFIRNVEI